MAVTIKAEAELVQERGSVYGHPLDGFGKVTGMARALWGRGPQTPEEHALYMILVKLARLEATPGHQDSLDDIRGYVRTYEMIRERRAQEEAAAFERSHTR